MRTSRLILILAFASWALPPGAADQDPAEDAGTAAVRAALEEIYMGCRRGGAKVTDVQAFARIQEIDGYLEKVHAIIEKVTTPSRQKVGAVYLLVGLKKKESVYPLLLVLADTAEPTYVRGLVARSLPEFGDPRGVIPLLDILRADEPELWSDAGWALGGFAGDERALRGARELLVHPTPGVRAAAVEGLERLAPEDLTRTLLDAYRREREPEPRIALTYALGRLGAREAADGMVADLESKDVAVLMAVIESLGAIGPAAREKALGRLQAIYGTETRAVLVGMAAGAMARIAPDSVEVARALVGRVGDPDRQLDLSSKIALIQMKTKEVVDLLVEELGREEATEERRNGLAEVLHRLTKNDLGTDAAAWSRWWNERRGDFEFPAEEE
ncbi:MAG: HEAT repeat domain-containing protein [Planctomycetes bacterium]|nr:HEAT repeat domain-containing protein [Planctomycetota bacterium]